MAIATAPAYDPTLDQRSPPRSRTSCSPGWPASVPSPRSVGACPIVGGGVGLVTDGLATFQVGQYAAREMKARTRASAHASAALS